VCFILAVLMSSVSSPSFTQSSINIHATVTHFSHNLQSNTSWYLPISCKRCFLSKYEFGRALLHYLCHFFFTFLLSSSKLTGHGV
jgi:hypothetical protein